MGDRIIGRPLTVGHGNEDIRFVEDDESSSERHLPPKPPEISVQVPKQNNNCTGVAISKAGSYIEISSSKLSEPRHMGVRPKEKLRVETTQKIRRSSEIIHSLFSRTPSFKKNRQEYEKVSVREDSTYSCIPESPSTKAPNETTFRLRGFAGAEHTRKLDAKGEDDEQILEILRQVVRKCTNPDPMKRLSSNDVLDLVDDS